MTERARFGRAASRDREQAVFRALADPTRRKILALLVDGPRTVNAIAERFPVSRPAVSKHLAVLKDAGLVAERKDGRERRYALEAEPLRAVVAYARGLERFWAARLAALGEHLGRDD